MNETIAKQAQDVLTKYLEKEISGEELTSSLKMHLTGLENLSKNQQVTIKYYEDFFEKEGTNYYVKNPYIDEEVSEFKEFLESL